MTPHSRLTHFNTLSLINYMSTHTFVDLNLPIILINSFRRGLRGLVSFPNCQQNFLESQTHNFANMKFHCMCCWSISLRMKKILPLSYISRTQLYLMKYLCSAKGHSIFQYVWTNDGQKLLILFKRLQPYYEHYIGANLNM